MWHLTFGGHVRSGQTYEENVLDELYDEIGLAPELSELIFVGYSQNPVHKHHAANYIYRWNGQLDELTLHDGEVAQVKSVTIPEYQQMLDRGEHAHPISPLLQKYLDSVSL
jgi:ADP-ribose pyrophosphatase YjhB (NUDIX family)